MKENYFSAATLVADLSNPTFDGHIEYDALDDGSPTNYSGIFVFASGLRNPFGLTMHSNGNLYGTDNGPNLGYGTFDLSSCELLVPHIVHETRFSNHLTYDFFLYFQQFRTNENGLR